MTVSLTILNCFFPLLVHQTINPHRDYLLHDLERTSKCQYKTVFGSPKPQDQICSWLYWPEVACMYFGSYLHGLRLLWSWSWHDSTVRHGIYAGTLWWFPPLLQTRRWCGRQHQWPAYRHTPNRHRWLLKKNAKRNKWRINLFSFLNIFF